VSPNNDSEFANFRGVKAYRTVAQTDGSGDTAVELVHEDGSRTGPYTFSWNKMIQLRTKVPLEQ
jgi:hypothetical protein